MSETTNAPEVGNVLLLPVGKLLDDPDNPRTERDSEWEAKLEGMAFDMPAEDVVDESEEDSDWEDVPFDE